MTLFLAVVALAGWAVAALLWRRQQQHVCPVERPTRALLLDASGRPESVRSLRGALPPVYTRPRKGQPAQVYAKCGVAAVYQASDQR